MRYGEYLGALRRRGALTIPGFAFRIELLRYENNEKKGGAVVEFEWTISQARPFFHARADEGIVPPRAR